MKKQLLFTLIIFSFNGLLYSQSFTDVAMTQGINIGFGAPIGFGGGVSFCDFNGDGLDDLSFASTSGMLPLIFFKTMEEVFPKLLL